MNSNTNTTPRRANAGFTLIELLVVIFIIMLLVGVGVFAMKGTMATAQRAVAEQLMTSMMVGLTAYQKDFDSLPPSKGDGGKQEDSFGRWAANWEGAEIVTQALVGPQPEELDGQRGESFRYRGRQYGPYVNLKPENLYARWDKNDNNTLDSDEVYWSGNKRNDAYVICVGTGASKSPILYYLKGPSLGTNRKSWDYLFGKGGQYNTDDNRMIVEAVNRQRIRTYSGNGDEIASAIPEEKRPGLRQELNSGDVLLVWAGSDDTYGVTYGQKDINEKEMKVSEDDLLKAGPK